MSKFSKLRHSIKREAVLHGRLLGYVGHAVEVCSVNNDFLFKDGNIYYAVIDGEVYNEIEGREHFFFLRQKLFMKRGIDNV